MMRPVRLDAALAVLTSLAVVGGAALAGDLTAGGTAPLAAWLGLLLLARRRWPVPVLAVTVTALAGVGGSDLGTPGWVWPATVAYVTVVLAGEFRWALGIGLVNVGVMTAFVPSATQLAVETLWLAVVLAGGYAYLGRARHRVTEERLAIARELHDVVAHTLAVVGIHLNVAADTLDDDPEEAREALRLAQSVRGQAMADLRSLIGVLRSGPTLDGVPDLRELVTRTSKAGLRIRLDGDLAGLPAPVALAAYRVVQEGLTNVLKHASASSAEVRVARADDEVTVSVVDDGNGGPVTPSGHGLAGMHERVTALGGTLDAGPAGTGFALTARLPLP
jgi:signal transduction histidine kinase